MPLVEITKDCAPYCTGDKLQMDDDEIKDLEALAEKRGVSKPYKVVADPSVPKAAEQVEAVDTTEGERVNDVLPQKAVDANLTAPGVEAEQAVEAEREAKVIDRKSKKQSNS